MAQSGGRLKDLFLSTNNVLTGSCEPHAPLKGKIMKSAKPTYTTAVALLVALAIPVSLAAQEDQNKHHKYNLIDIGTFGGAKRNFQFF
jgi:hypothetical protein